MAIRIRLQSATEHFTTLGKNSECSLKINKRRGYIFCFSAFVDCISKKCISIKHFMLKNKENLYTFEQLHGHFRVIKHAAKIGHDIGNGYEILRLKRDTDV